MSTPEITKNLSVSTLYLGVGMIVGSVLSALTFVKGEPILASTWTCSFGLMFLLAYSHSTGPWWRLIVSSIIASFLAVLPWNWPNGPSGDLGFLSVINFYAINAFHIAYQQHGKNIPYESLFYAVWDTFVKLLIAAIFTGACWIVLGTWQLLFKFIGIDFFSKLFSSSWFILWTLPFFGAIGLFISEQSITVVRSLRMIILLICKYILPVVAIVGSVFLAGYVLTLVFAQTNTAPDPSILLLVSFASVILINGVFQDGHEAQPYPNTILRLIINVFIVLLPAFTLIAAKIMFFDKMTSGNPWLNVKTFNTLVNISLLLLCNLWYALIALRRKALWMQGIQLSNITLAMLLISIVTLTNNPLFQKASFNPGRVLPSISDIAGSYTPSKEKIQHAVANVHKAFNKTPLKWTESDDEAIVFGYRDNQPLFLCSSKINDLNYVGEEKNEECHIIKDDTIENPSSYDILSGPDDEMKWQTIYPYVLEDGMELYPILTANSKENYNGICRVIHNNRIYLGNSSPNTGNCSIIFKNKIITINDGIQYLYFK